MRVRRREAYRIHRARCRQSGMTLIEVLVSMILLTVALLSMVIAQARVSQMSSDAEDRNRAAMLANELATMMWQNRTVSLPASVVSTWQTMVATNVSYRSATTSSAVGSGLGGLPNGTGTVSVNAATNTATITITWQAPSRGINAAAGMSGTSQYVTQVVLP
ncbi:prepilin-type N-terminal cleavage/methylation domain-containing protein [Cupriavidus metallidurans]|jgi:type IV pilus assembly protein PilV|uniref:Prepilin-type N-terminal cleavage/methylation domain-containing protein n=2 Tax=Cupriavidus metallidurans TaxID=119219 RepID=A0A482IKC6_9BURK|nr:MULTISPECIES: prepilin-type N-terminal cleavage/methylation domain-containing protein [Cupriavidus]QBP08406.1 prepilin-type N-terminal cleavage/methylation domain-containing protein [Cupriavidus metallidurans]QWC88827.1 prepilin-type N-terminal cleavage/methylation domain-containing protein [Cupriavidus metallidurans]